MQNGQAAANSLLAACQELGTSSSAFRCLLGQAVTGICTDCSTGHVETITTNNYRHVIPVSAVPGALLQIVQLGGKAMSLPKHSQSPHVSILRVFASRGSRALLH